MAKYRIYCEMNDGTTEVFYYQFAGQQEAKDHIHYIERSGTESLCGMTSGKSIKIANINNMHVDIDNSLIM